MKTKFVITFLAILGSIAALNAQSIKETFDSNSLGWNETPKKIDSGTSIIEKGVLTIKTEGTSKFWQAMTGESSCNWFICSCYAPLNMDRSFTIVTNVTIGKLDDDKYVGLVFNYKDDGNFYAFIFSDEMVYFVRREKHKLVGSKHQGVRWSVKRKARQNWRLESDTKTISFFVDDVPIMKMRYMPLEYTGFGFYTFGKQKLEVDDIEFIQ